MWFFGVGFVVYVVGMCDLGGLWLAWGSGD